jgi:hypothetical protein
MKTDHCKSEKEGSERERWVRKQLKSMIKVE